MKYIVYSDIKNIFDVLTVILFSTLHEKLYLFVWLGQTVIYLLTKELITNMK